MNLGSMCVITDLLIFFFPVSSVFFSSEWIFFEDTFYFLNLFSSSPGNPTHKWSLEICVVFALNYLPNWTFQTALFSSISNSHFRNFKLRILNKFLFEKKEREEKNGINYYCFPLNLLEKIYFGERFLEILGSRAREDWKKWIKVSFF